MGKKNLLFLFTDQQRHDTLAVGGNSKIQTPNLNRLADEGVAFTQAYVAQPVCTPSRGTIMTGLFPHNHGAIGNNVALRRETPTLPELLNDAEYRTGYIGKWHLGDEIYAQHGFEEWASIEDNYHTYVSEGKDKHGHCSYYHFLLENGFKPDDVKDGYEYFSRKYCTSLPEQFSKPAYIANEATRFIREHKDEPFVLYCNFLEPHSPYNSAFDNMYAPEYVDLPPCFDLLPSPDTTKKAHKNRIQYHEKKGFNNEQVWRELIARYWGMVSLVDKQIGRILEVLKENGLEDNTVVVFTSDHGDMMGDFHMQAKGVMFQSAVRVPLIIKAAGASRPRGVLNEPVSTVDLIPTLLDMLGRQTDQPLDGKSLYPAMKGEQSLKSNDVIIEWNIRRGEDEGGCIRTIVTPDGWKLALSEVGEHELYHLAEDPRESTNLYFKGGHDDKIAELKAKIAVWQTRTGDQAAVLG